MVYNILAYLAAHDFTIDYYDTSVPTFSAEIVFKSIVQTAPWL